ncbi:MAG: hypothetical protein HYV09_22850 [Deltaproteobacteria bacterium]|nr:hypothetical protein [Deltaproteobacteria bacterium]
MHARPVRGGPVLLVLATLALVLPLSLVGTSARATSRGDLEPQPTTKTGGEPTTKSTELSTGGTTLTPTPPPAVKTGGTGGVAKPPPAAGTAPPPDAAESVVPPASASEQPPAAASAPPPKSGPRPFSRRKVELGVADLAVSLSMPETWPELPPEALPEVDEHKDVTVVARKGFGAHDPKGKPPVVEEVIVACGKASGEFWADSIRDAAFTQMIAAIEKEAARYTTLKSIEPDAVRAEGDRYLQSFAADADYAVDGKAAPTQAGKGKPKAASAVKLQGLSFIGFHAEGEGKTPDIVACSVACAHLVADGEDSVCPAVIGSIEISGSFTTPPKRSFLADLLFKLKTDPTTLWLGVVGAIFLLLVSALVLVLVLRRKKRAHEAHDEAEHEDEDFAAGYHAGLAAAQAAAEIKATMHASPPPPDGFFDPQTLTRRKL